jgi:hypothetical protein
MKPYIWDKTIDESDLAYRYIHMTFGSTISIYHEPAERLATAYLVRAHNMHGSLLDSMELVASNIEALIEMIDSCMFLGYHVPIPASEYKEE